MWYVEKHGGVCNSEMCFTYFDTSVNQQKWKCHFLRLFYFKEFIKSTKALHESILKWLNNVFYACYASYKFEYLNATSDADSVFSAVG